MPIRGPYYSKADIERVWIEEGGRSAAADTASAIVLAESGGGAGSISDNPGPGLTNYGWFQVARDHADNFLDIRVNTREAIKQSDNGRNWCDWQTWDGRGCRPGPYTSGYKRFLDGAPPPAADTTGGGSTEPTNHKGAPLPEAENQGEREWDPAPKIRAAASARGGHAAVMNVAARNVLTKLARWRLPR